MQCFKWNKIHVIKRQTSKEIFLPADIYGGSIALQRNIKLLPKEKKVVVTMPIISPIRDFGVFKRIFESSWSGPWIFGSKNDGRDGKHRDLNTLPIVHTS